MSKTALTPTIVNPNTCTWSVVLNTPSFPITRDLNPALPQVMQCDASPPPPTTSLSSYQLTVAPCSVYVAVALKMMLTQCLDTEGAPHALLSHWYCH